MSCLSPTISNHFFVCRQSKTFYFSKNKDQQCTDIQDTVQRDQQLVVHRDNPQDQQLTVQQDNIPHDQQSPLKVVKEEKEEEENRGANVDNNILQRQEGVEWPEGAGVELLEEGDEDGLNMPKRLKWVCNNVDLIAMGVREALIRGTSIFDDRFARKVFDYVRRNFTFNRFEERELKIRVGRHVSFLLSSPCRRILLERRYTSLQTAQQTRCGELRLILTRSADGSWKSEQKQEE